MASAKSREERLFGAAVLKTSFVLRGGLDSPAFKTIFPGVLRDLELEESEVDAFIDANKARVEKAAKGTLT